jgi:predicted PhzF superfamily epimerase YddE/YHI9
MWAWVDEVTGVVRARAFPRRGDAIVEDEATGAAALQLTAELGRSLTVHQGVGSEIRTQLQPDGRIAVGGRVTLVDGALEQHSGAGATVSAFARVRAARCDR